LDKLGKSVGAVSPTASRGVTYHSKNNTKPPCVTSDVESGTFSKTWAIAELERRINLPGSPQDVLLPRAITRPHPRAEIGAKKVPTDARPSVANREAFQFPSPYIFIIVIDNGSVYGQSTIGLRIDS